MVTLKGFRAAPPEVKAKQPRFSALRPTLKEWFSGGASDLRGFSPERHDQLHSGSCVAQSVVRAMEVNRIQKLFYEAISRGVSEGQAVTEAKAGHVALSRLALYFHARELMDPQETGSDEGTYVGVAAEALKTIGVCREKKDPGNPSDRSFWPFELGVNPASGRPRLFEAPSWMAMREAYLHKISAWYRVDTDGEERVKDVILALSAGHPVVYGAKADSQWMSYDGSEPIGLVQGDVIGGHATVLEGWDPSRQVFLGENSWGDRWGVRGPDGTGGFYEVTAEKIASDECDDFVVIEGGWEPWRKK
ncbi:MAG: hypothetical protein BWY99_02506 [Synergistetes bacterium ADurb.BinA166]|nr:MAG: hypothetical protein BWY99_02506 [Synergistetes bacterium ADurb.BinA166]